MKAKWWKRYAITLDGKTFYFITRRDALWALRVARTLVPPAEGKDRWTGETL